MRVRLTRVGRGGLRVSPSFPTFFLMFRLELVGMCSYHVWNHINLKAFDYPCLPGILSPIFCPPPFRFGKPQTPSTDHVYVYLMGYWEVWGGVGSGCQYVSQQSEKSKSCRVCEIQPEMSGISMIIYQAKKKWTHSVCDRVFDLHRKVSSFYTEEKFSRKIYSVFNWF